MKKLLIIGALLLGLSAIGYAKEIAPQPKEYYEEIVAVAETDDYLIDPLFSVYPTRIYVNGGVGYGLYDKVANTRGAREIASEVSLEVTKEYFENVETGLGVAFQKHGEPGDRSYDGVNFQLAEFTSIPVYATVKYNFATTEKGWKPFVKADVGYSFNSMDDSKAYDEELGLLLRTRVTDGVYVGATVGAEKNNVLLGLGYRFNKADIKWQGERDHYNSHRVMATIGYKFDM